jgi:hypothetical protein
VCPGKKTTDVHPSAAGMGSTEKSEGVHCNKYNSIQKTWQKIQKKETPDSKAHHYTMHASML